MAEFTVVLARSARKELEKLPARLQERMLRQLARLSNTPRPEGVRKIVAATDLWRLRVGVYRIIYEVRDDECVVDIIAIRHRRDAYQ